MNNLNILLLGAGNRTEFVQFLTASAKKYRYVTKIFSLEDDLEKPIRYLAEIIKGKSFKNPKTLANARSIIKNYNIHICLSLNDKATSLLPKLQDICFAPSPTTNLIKVFEDKLLMNEFLMQNKFSPVPSTRSIPLVVKPRKGFASRGIFFIDNIIDLKDLLKTIDVEDYLMQKWLKGAEVSVDCYKSPNGKYFFTARKRLKMINGECVDSIFIKNKKIDKIINKILQQDGILGPLNIQFIQDIKSRKYYLSDINSRFGGGMTLSTKAGVPWLEFLICDYANLPWPNFKFNSNARVMKTFSSYRVR